MRAEKKKAGYYVLLWVVSLIFFLPVLWIIMAAFKTREDILAWPPKFIFTPTVANFIDLFSRPKFVTALTNSVVIAFAAIIIAVVVSFLAGYAFSRLKPKLTGFMMFMLLSIRMVPGAATVIPMFMMYSALGWKSTHLGIILFYAMFSIPFSVWIIKGFLDGVSTKYDETALVNGAGRLNTMFRVILPQIKAGLVASFIFNIIFVWNEFLFGFILGGDRVQTMPLALATETYTSSGIDWPYVASMSVINLLPLLILLFFFQKYLLVGMTFGTVRDEI